MLLLVEHGKHMAFASGHVEVFMLFVTHATLFIRVNSQCEGSSSVIYLGYAMLFKSGCDSIIAIDF